MKAPDRNPSAQVKATKQERLTTLCCAGSGVSDLSVLRKLPLKSLFCEFKAERDTDLLRSITTLETINFKPAAEFWKEVEQEGKKP